MPLGLDQPRRCNPNEKRCGFFSTSPTQQEQEQMLLPFQQSPEDQKKTRNRLAQRKHRERLRNDSIPGATGEGESTRDIPQSFSRPGSPWKTPWGSSAQPRSTRITMEDQNEYQDPFSYNNLSTGKTSFFPNTTMDCTGITIPGIDLPQLTTLEEEWQRVPNSQPEYITHQHNQPQNHDALYSTHLPSPVHSEQHLGYQHQYFDKRHDNESSHSVEVEAMEIDVPKIKPGMARKDSNASSTASNESQKTASTDPGSAFEQILDVIEEAGFDNIDTMAAQYYSANFEPNSTSQLAQATSRSRDLRRLLQSLQKAAKEWTKQETQAYEEEIVRSAKNICQEELRVFRQRQANRPHRPSIFRTESAPGSSSSSSSSVTGQSRYAAGTVDQLRQLLRKEESSQPTQQEKRLLRQRLPETWSLLSELARDSDLPPAQVSQVVYTFLHMTTGSTTG